jgi:hypothetical protein
MTAGNVARSAVDPASRGENIDETRLCSETYKLEATNGPASLDVRVDINFVVASVLRPVSASFSAGCDRTAVHPTNS